LGGDSIPAPDGDAATGGRAVAEAVADPLIVVGEGRILVANRAARAVLGDWIVGQDVRLAIRHPAALDRLLGRGGGGDDEAQIVGIGGPERRWTMAVAPFGEGHRAVRFTDVSAAFAAERMRVDFVANASHELRTPLATLLGFLETLQAEDARADPVTLDRFLGIMEGEAKRMQRLIDDLLSLSRIEAQRFSAPDEAIALRPLAEEARDNLRHLAAERGSEVRIEAPDDLAAVAGDRTELLQLLDNLIGNALRYGREGSPVTVSLERDGPMLHLAVRDEGEGIAAEHIPRLTQRFYRVDPGRSRAVGGTGLGLAIVKHIVERHRGQLEIESKVGVGTTVHVRLPLA
jgi:two-component system phosphate regulon sensor histidine kinase PhoR